MSLYLQQGLLPASRQFHIGHTHPLHRLVDIHPFLGRDDALAGTGDIVTPHQGGDDGGTGGRRAYAQVPDGLLRLFVRDVFSAGLHCRQQGGFRVQRFGQGLLLRQPMPHDRNGLAFGKLCGPMVSFRLVLLLVLHSGEHTTPSMFGNAGRTGAEIHPLTSTFHDQQVFLTGR